jgi:transcriptional regulator with XRE-family HTH domain
MGRKRRVREVTRIQGYWIKFKMAINGITQYDIAAQAGCSSQMVSQVLKGRKNSERVKAAIIHILGQEVFETMTVRTRKGGAT